MAEENCKAELPLEFYFTRDPDMLFPVVIPRDQVEDFENAILDKIEIDIEMDNLCKITKYDGNGKEVVTLKK